MSNQTLPLTAELYEYLRRTSVKEADILQECRQFTSSLPTAKMQISPEQGQFMQFMVQLIGAKKCLEIGVYTGYSSLSVALALPETGTLIACDNSVEFTQFAEQFWQKAHVEHKIQLRLAPALDSLNALLHEGHENSFDFIFIDADKPSYPDYYEKSLLLLKVGGLIMIDNVLQEGKVMDENCKTAGVIAIRALNQKILDDARVSSVMLPVSDGITLVMKR